MPFEDYLRSNLGQLVMFTFAGAAALQGLVAVWAATAPRHWFIRAIVVWSSVMLLVPVRIYEPAAALAIASPLIVLLVSAVGWLEQGQPPWTSTYLLRPGERWTSAAFILVTGILAGELVFPGRWWFEPLVFLAWCAIVVFLAATIYDGITTGGCATRQRLLALVRLGGTSLRLATSSIDHSAMTAHAEPVRQTNLRFQVRDLFWVTLLVSLAVVGVQTIDQNYTAAEWRTFATWGALVALVVSAAYACVISGFRLVLLPVLAVAVALAARFAPGPGGSFFAERFVEAVGYGRTSPWTGQQKLQALEIVYAQLALLVMVVTSLKVFSQAGMATALPRRLARGFLRIGLTLAGLWFTWLYWQMFVLTPVPPAFASGRTYHQEIADITQHADPRSYWGSPVPPVAGDTPRTLPVTGDRLALIAELETFLRFDNCVPFEVSDRVFRAEDVTNFRRLHEQFCAFAQVVDDEALRAALRRESERAADLALINVRLGSMLRRGGTEWHANVGRYCQSYGYQRLAKIRGSLAPGTLRQVVDALAHAALQSEEPAVVRARSQAFEERAIGWTERLRNVFDSLARGEHSWDPNAEINTLQILLQTDLALRLFQHEHQRWPGTLEELAPAYLPAVPVDPWAESKQPLKYRPEESDFVLYSVNSFGIDNGGVFGDMIHGIHHSTHDVDLETWIRP